MKTQLKLLVSILALGVAGASVSLAASADKPDRAGKRVQAAAADRMKQLDETLQLTDAQKQQIKDIWAKQAEELKALSPEDRRSKGRDALAATHDQVRAVLTSEQQTKFDAMRPEGRPGNGNGKAKGKGKKAE